jgi:hypothetical protein
MERKSALDWMNIQFGRSWKMKNKGLILILAILMLLSWSSNSLSLIEGTHQQINEYIAQHSINGYSLKEYLINNLGLGKGVDEIITGIDADGPNISHEIFWWLGYGGFQEDRPGSASDYILNRATRSNNHFHDPLEGNWDFAGLDSMPYSGQSSILWAQNANQNPGGKWSWHDARDYFYKGLTLTDKTKRDGAMANTFRALGQLMHLIQDASVPAHTRNQIHPFFNYEKWLDRIRIIESDIFNKFIISPLSFDPSILNGTPNALAKIPIAKIIDTGKYYASKDPNTTTGSGIGIAEYTNANFFSEHTIFSEVYPYPKKESSVEIKPYFIPDPRGSGTHVQRYYYQKIGDGEKNFRLATVGVLKDYITKYFPSYNGKDKPALDGGVYSDYASLLLPRAVGYSAGLLKYFFRGELHIEVLVPSVDPLPSADQSGYHFGNRNDTGTDINTVAVFIQNNSKLKEVIEPVGNGTLTLTVGYTDTEDGAKVYQTAGTASVTEIPSVGSGKTLPVLFPLSQPIPSQRAKDLTYYFAFKGKLGQEEDAVIGKVVKAPVLYRATPDQGTEGTVVTIAGDNLPDPAGQPETRGVCFNADQTKPYIIELISRTETEIKVKVPNTASLEKPGYGGLRVKNVLEGEQVIYSNPLSFFPIAEGKIENSAQVPINVTIEAARPIYGDYKELPRPISYPVLQGDSLSIQLMTGFIYHVTGGATDMTKDIKYLTPDLIDFVLQVH